MLKVGYGKKWKVINLQNYQFYKWFLIKIFSKVTYIFLGVFFFLQGDSSIHDSQLQLTIMDEDDGSLVL